MTASSKRGTRRCSMLRLMICYRERFNVDRSPVLFGEAMPRPQQRPRHTLRMFRLKKYAPSICKGFSWQSANAA